MKRASMLLFGVIVALSLAGCGSKSTTSPSGSGGGSSSGGSGGSNPAPGTNTSLCSNVPGSPATGTLTARVDGIAWNAGSCIAVNLSAPGVIGIGGLDSASNQIFGFATTRGVGVTSIGPVSGTNALISIGGSALWQAVLSNGSGTVNITTLTTNQAAGSNQAAGTFSFTLPPAANTTATGTKTVTNGSFDVRF